ncbi:MAG: VIT family protein [Candidatus Krumholzibacteria bacterium]|nr:VIT family protein [Candidatus Krumholzibacteria bacterium]MDH4336981.1 VIT family protein [Candidatus Krumholzibacteria bacterium]MDH5270704.1 VIT family protein [Candidatus Krumholzibacteria bacterium]
MSSLRQSFINKYLDPGDSLGEVLFGLIMVLTFTLGTGLSAGEGSGATRTLLIAAIGCNLAWGLIDGLMYVMGCMFARSRDARLIRKIRATQDPKGAVTAIAGELDEKLDSISTREARHQFYEDVVTTIRRKEPVVTRVTREDIYGGIASFWLVFVSAIPAVIPFLFIDSTRIALRTSNALLVAMLFLVGHRWGRETNGRPWAVGVFLMLFGVALVFIAIVLGG